MSMFSIKSEVTIDIEMVVEARTLVDAEHIFNEKLVISASLIDVPENKFRVIEETIVQIGDVSIEPK